MPVQNETERPLVYAVGPYYGHSSHAVCRCHYMNGLEVRNKAV